jgi:hypothetical protein
MVAELGKQGDKKRGSSSCCGARQDQKSWWLQNLVTMETKLCPIFEAEEAGLEVQQQ